MFSVVNWQNSPSGDDIEVVQLANVCVENRNIQMLKTKYQATF